MEHYKIVKSEKLLEAKIIDVVRDTVTLPNGKTAEREVVYRGKAAAIVPIDDDGNIIFVKQYRHPYREYVLEIPAGVLEDDETDPMNCAKRELEEETAYKTDDITFLMEIYPSAGYCKENLYLYLAENLKQGKQNLDEDEFVTVEKYDIDTAIKMIFTGEIKDAKTIAGLLTYKLFLLKEIDLNK